MKEKCQNCVSRLLCPNYKIDDSCMGCNDEQVFNGLLKLMLFARVNDKDIDIMLERVKKFQKEREEN